MAPFSIAGLVGQTHYRRYFLVCAFCILSFGGCQSHASGQTNKAKRLSPTIPPRFEKLLRARLVLFTKFQAQGERDKVIAMLAMYQSASEEGKALVLERIKLRPIINFVPEVTIESTGNYGVPMSKRWWEIIGCGEYRGKDGVERIPVALWAFFKQGDWFFSNFAEPASLDRVPLSCTKSVIEK